MRNSNQSDARLGRATPRQMLIETLAFTLPLLGILLMLLCWAGILQWSPLHLTFGTEVFEHHRASAIRFFGGLTWFALGALAALVADNSRKSFSGKSIEN